MAASGKKPYEKPEVETERIFEALGAGPARSSSRQR